MKRINAARRCWNRPHAKRLLARAFVCGMLLILPSCGIPKLRLAQPAPQLPATFNGAASASSSALLTVDAFFNDPALTRLTDQAVLSNRELKYLEEEVVIARAEVLRRQGAFLPFLSFGAGAGVEKPSQFTPAGAVESGVQFRPGQNFPDPLPSYNMGVNLSWTVDIWRQLRNARDAAALRYYAAIERRNDFVTRLVAQVAENYFKLMSLDKRMETLDLTIQLQEDGRKIAQAKLAAGRGTELAVQRFQAEVRKAQSEKFIVAQEIVETENKVNFLANRYPVQVERNAANFLDLNIPISLGVPAQLLLNRPDIREAERELVAAGLDVNVARANFFPKLDITGGVGYQAFNLKYLFYPDAIAGNVAGNLTAPLLNKKAIQADYITANARQLEAVYNYQRIVLNAFTEVVNNVTMVENYRRGLEIKKQQLQSLEASVQAAVRLFQNARAEYVEVLLAQRDFMDARMVLIQTKQKQMAAVVNTYQALGGGASPLSIPLPPLPGAPGPMQGPLPELPPPPQPQPQQQAQAQVQARS
jgi:multidrug efflux system outer membrane protein